MRGKGILGRRLLALVGTIIIAVSMTPAQVLADDNTVVWNGDQAIEDVALPDGNISDVTVNALNAEADSYVWTLTSQQTYLPPSGINGGERHHRAIDSIRSKYWSGTTSDGFLQLHVKYYTVDSNDPWSIDCYHECSQPKASYTPGEEAVLTMRAYVQNPVNYNYCRASSSLYIAEENKEADGVEYGTYVTNNKNALEKFTRKGESSTSLTPRDESANKYINASATVYANMPKSTNEGEHIAIVFSDEAGTDNVSLSPKNEYGGTCFQLWIYTLQKKSNPVAVKVGKTKITKISKVNKKKFCVKWKKVSGASGYQFQMSKSKKFKKIAYDGTNESKYNYVNFKNVTKGTWYFRVRAFKTVNGNTIYGKWSAVKKYKWKK